MNSLGTTRCSQCCVAASTTDRPLQRLHLPSTPRPRDLLQHSNMRHYQQSYRPLRSFALSTQTQPSTTTVRWCQHPTKSHARHSRRPSVWNIHSTDIRRILSVHSFTSVSLHSSSWFADTLTIDREIAIVLCEQRVGTAAWSRDILANWSTSMIRTMYVVSPSSSASCLKDRCNRW